MRQIETMTSFPDQLKRILFATSIKTQVELSDFLGVRQSVVSDAKRRGKIPADWLLTLILAKNINPEWVLTGRGRLLLEVPTDNYETADTTREKAEFKETLNLLPSRMLAEELLRRVSVAAVDKFSR